MWRVRWSVAVALLVASVRPPAALAFAEVHYVMGTYLRIDADEADSVSVRTAMRHCFARTRELEARFSRFDPESELSRLNASRSVTVDVSPEMAALLRRGLAVSAATDGAFDVGIGALTHLWRTATTWPTAPSIRAAQRLGGARAFTVSSTSVERRPGVMVDLDGIAKGWAVDECVGILRAGGVSRALVNFGESSLFALAAPLAAPEGWRVGLRDLSGAGVLGSIVLRDEALSVSATFGHERQLAGRRVGHIVDPHSGRPLTTPGIAAVVAPWATDAEGLSKALLIRPRPFAPAVGAGAIWTGALVVRPDRIWRVGRIDFTEARSTLSARAEAEAIR